MFTDHIEDRHQLLPSVQESHGKGGREEHPLRVTAQPRIGSREAKPTRHIGIHQASHEGAFKPSPNLFCHIAARPIKPPDPRLAIPAPLLTWYRTTQLFAVQQSPARLPDTGQLFVRTRHAKTCRRGSQSQWEEGRGRSSFAPTAGHASPPMTRTQSRFAWAHEGVFAGQTSEIETPSHATGAASVYQVKLNSHM